MARKRDTLRGVGLLLFGGAAGAAANEHLTGSEVDVQQGEGEAASTPEDAPAQKQPRGLANYGEVVIPANTEVSAGVATFRQGYCPYVMVQNDREEAIEVTIAAEFLSRRGGLVAAGTEGPVSIDAGGYHVAVFDPEGGDDAAATVNTLDLCRVELVD